MLKNFSVDNKISQRNAAIFMAMCAFLWSTSGAMVKYIEWSGIAINFMRSLIAGVALLLYLIAIGQKLVVNKNTLLAAVFVCAKYSTFILGNKLTSSATMIALQYTSPVFVLLFSFLFFKQKIRGKDMAVAVAAMVGIAMLTLDRTGPSSLAGNLLGIAAGVTMALMFLFTSKAESYAESLSIIVLGHLCTAAVMLPFVVGEDMPMTARNVGGIVLLGLFQQAAAYALYGFAIRSASALTCNLVGSIDPLLNPVWSAILIHEIPGINTFVGYIIVFGSITAWSVSNTLESNKSVSKK